jgi:hypothetical protein
MDRNTYILNKDLNGETGSYAFPIKAFNTNEIKLIFNFYPNDFVDLIKMRIYFDKKTYTFEFDDIPKDFILERRTPIIKTTKDIIQIKLYYSNLNAFEYLMPVLFNTPSIIDDFDGGSITHMQFLDTVENDDLFFTLKNSRNQIYNFRSGSNVITYRQTRISDDIETPIIAGMSAINTMESVTSNIVTQFSEYIEVNT